MTSSDSYADKLAVCREERGTGSGNPPKPHQNDSIASELWDKEEKHEASSTSDDLKFELETLTIKKERLIKENRRLVEMLESIKLEKVIASLKEEVSVLGEEKEQILIEIQRRKPLIAKDVSKSAIPTSSN